MTAEQHTETHVAIEHLYKHFGDFTALTDISLSIQKGEFVCFLGPSGCGKTTLLRAIAGLDVQSQGQIFMNGEDVSHYPPSMRDFGIVFQNYALFPNLTVNKNVAYGMQGRGHKKAFISERVKELLAQVGLPDQGKKFPKELSGGQQQRVALARALAVSPGMLLLDEPLSALDAKVRSHLRQEIKNLQRDLGVTTIMVTHDQEEALSMADRIVLMRGGKIEQIGTPEDLYARPANAFVASFIGEMNFVDALRHDDNVLKVGDVALTFDSHNAYTDETAVTLAIRPESIRLNDGSSTNTLQATMTDSEYLGSTLRARLSGGDLHNNSLRADIPMNIVKSLALGNGTTLPITLPAEHLLVFDRNDKKAS